MRLLIAVDCTTALNVNRLLHPARDRKEIKREARRIRPGVQSVGAPGNPVEAVNVVNAVEDRAGLHALNVRQRLLHDARHALQMPLAALCHRGRCRVHHGDSRGRGLPGKGLRRLDALRPALALCPREHRALWNAHAAGDLAESDAAGVGGADLLPFAVGKTVAGHADDVRTVFETCQPYQALGPPALCLLAAGSADTLTIAMVTMSTTAHNIPRLTPEELSARPARPKATGNKAAFLRAARGTMSKGKAARLLRVIEASCERLDE